MTETGYVLPFPAPEIDACPFQESQSGRDIVLPPFLVGEFNRPPVFDSLDFLPLTLGFSPGRQRP